jgi:hypothetical protein
MTLTQSVSVHIKLKLFADDAKFHSSIKIDAVPVSQSLDNLVA